jgi:hypothetical protein
MAQPNGAAVEKCIEPACHSTISLNNDFEPIFTTILWPRLKHPPAKIRRHFVMLDNLAAEIMPDTWR